MNHANQEAAAGREREAVGGVASIELATPGRQWQQLLPQQQQQQWAHAICVTL